MAPKAFRTIGLDTHVRAAEKGIDLERSFRNFMATLFDCEPDSPRIDKLITDAETQPLYRTAPARTAAPKLIRPRRSVLTPVEQQTLHLFATGVPLTEIGALLGKSPHTIRSYVKSLRGKLGARNLAHAVTIALRAGILQPADIDADEARAA